MEGDLDVHMVEDIKRVLLVELGLEKEKKKKIHIQHYVLMVHMQESHIAYL